MKKILSLALLCSLPLPIIANGPARRVGTALIKLIQYSECIGRGGRFYKPSCSAPHVLPLHENSENTHTIRLSPMDTATVHITQAFLTEARIAIKFYQKDRLTSTPTITETTVTHLKPLDLEGGCVQQDVPGGVRYEYEKVEVRLTKKILPLEKISESDESKD